METGQRSRTEVISFDEQKLTRKYVSWTLSIPKRDISFGIN